MRGSSTLAFHPCCWQIDDMNKVTHAHADRIRTSRTFPVLRKSRCGQESLAAELKRLRKLSIEDRVLEALGMSNRFAWILSTPKHR